MMSDFRLQLRNQQISFTPPLRLRLRPSAIWHPKLLPAALYEYHVYNAILGSFRYPQLFSPLYKDKSAR